MRLTRHIGAALLFAALGGGCAAPARLYVNGDADMDFYQKVIVLPFANLTQDRFAGERITRVFPTELVMMDRFRIIDPGEVRAILDRTGGLSVDGSYDPKKLKDPEFVDKLVQRYLIQLNGGMGGITA